MAEITDPWSHRRREAGTTGKATDAAGRRRDDVGGRQRRRPCDEEGRQHKIGEIGSCHSAVTLVIDFAITEVKKAEQGG